MSDMQVQVVGQMVRETKELPKGWKTVVIGEIAEVIGGGTPSSKVDEYWGGNIPWLTPKDLSGYAFRRVKNGKRNITNSGLANSSARLLPRNTVLVTSRAPIGYVALADNEIATNQGFKSLILKDGYDPYFFYYLIKHNVPELESVSSGTTFKEISGKAFKQIKFKVPPLPEQKAIAHIIGSLDDKIELNRRMNETVEAMAQALFKSWFVDFDPVQTKAEGRDPNLPAEIANLFPDTFENSDLGPIPKGWNLKPIGDAVQCVGGATPSTKNPEFWEGGRHPFVTPKDMSSLQSPVILDSERHITNAGVEKISSKQLPVGTVILSSRAPIGYLGVATVPVSVNQGVIAMICDGELPNLYILHWAAANMDLIKSGAGGTTFTEISKRNFRPIPVLVPDISVLEAFMTKVVPLHERITLNVCQYRHLAGLRDTLLPKLLLGEVRIEQAEQILKYSYSACGGKND